MTTPNLRLTEMVLMGGSHDGVRWSVSRDAAPLRAGMIETADQNGTKFSYVPLLGSDGANKLDETGAKIYVCTGYYVPWANGIKSEFWLDTEPETK